MSNRVKGFTVVLSRDTHADDAKIISAAISALRGVRRVVPVEAEPADFIERSRILDEVEAAVATALFNARHGRQK